MGHTITTVTPRSTGSPLLLLLLSCSLHVTFADVSSAIPATYIWSSVDGQGSADLDDDPSAISSNPCGTLETGCKEGPTTEFQLPHHVLEKRSSYELRTLPDTVLAAKGSGGLGQLETAPGYRVGSTGNKVNRPAVDSRPIWNVPFRVVYGSGKNVVKFGKRSGTDGFDGYRFKFGKRSVDVVEKRMIKFGKRVDAVSDDQNLSSAEEEKRLIRFGKRVDDLQDDQGMDSGEEKRMIRFGKRADGLLDESGLEASGEKRLIRFGKRADDLQDDPGLDSGEEKRMIRFGKRGDDLQDDLGLGAAEEKRLIRFGKRADDQGLEDEEEKRMIRFGKRGNDNWSSESKLSADAEKRMIKFGKRIDQLSYDDQNNSAGDEVKRMFKLGKRISDDDDPQVDLNLLNEDENRKFSFGKRTDTQEVVPNLFGGEEKEARTPKVGKWSEALPEAENLKEYEDEKRMIKFGKKSNGFSDGKLSELESVTKEIVQFPNEEGKRMIKFGKKSDADDADVISSEDKRKIMFGKRSGDRNWDKNGQQFFEDGGLNSMETDVEEQLPPPEKRRQKFQFGRRFAPRQDELFAKVRSKFKLGKRSE